MGNTPNSSNSSIEKNQNSIASTIEPIQLIASHLDQTSVSNNVIPSSSNEVNDVVITMEDMNISENSTNCSRDASVAMVEGIDTCNQSCQSCAIKKCLIDEQKIQIQELQKELKKAKNKIWYLDTTKRRLNVTLSEMKMQQLIDQELYNTLQVQ